MPKRKPIHSLLQPPLWELEWPTLRFVVRRHLATRLHWDFRIEADERLYSWWMLQPPSMIAGQPVEMTSADFHDPKHMLSERVIPAGQPGAGPTLVEEFGWLMPVGRYQGSQQATFVRQWKHGRIHLRLEAEKLSGGFVIEKEGELWFITKLEDQHAKLVEPEWTGRSALTGRTLDEL